MAKARATKRKSNHQSATRARSSRKKANPLAQLKRDAANSDWGLWAKHWGFDPIGDMHPNDERALLDGCWFDLNAAEDVRKFFRRHLGISIGVTHLESHSPSCYLLSNSDLISKLGLSDSEFKHLLFLGEDSSVEVLAKTWSWDVVEENDQPPV